MLDWTFIINSIPLYLTAAKLTIGIAFLSIFLSILIGFIIVMIRFFDIKGLKGIAHIYIEVSRNTPLLVQLFFLYFGLPKLGIVLDSFTCGVTGLTFLGGSYMAEAFRTGLDNIDKIQTESAYSLGMNKGQVLRHIIFPQATINSIPVLSANIIFLFKETSVVSACALADLMYVTKDLIGLYYRSDEALLMLVIAYLIILLPISYGLSIVERKVRHGQFGY